MAFPTFKAVPVPQDTAVMLPNGQINPAWLHYFNGLSRLLVPLAELSGEAENTTAGLNTRLQKVEAEAVLLASPLDDVADPTDSAVAVTSPDATGGNPSTDDLANELKADLTSLVATVNEVALAVREINARLRALELIKG